MEDKARQQLLYQTGGYILAVETITELQNINSLRNFTFSNPADPSFCVYVSISQTRQMRLQRFLLCDAFQL